ncbi:origin recognition complex subunit 4 [Apophysomyces sp. BC1034]|nr:origin recognition complex subunit 4 [Apophysomyces sp. BC1015]KAG0178174.1 origin recognition complex subunit 4 [Apophysomyces sp. BC1021]KAG0188420.1 origin recognition complex subunit 4 [Apophysomyces sp. BC1034]
MAKRSADDALQQCTKRLCTESDDLIDHVATARRHLLSRLSEKTLPERLHGLEKEYDRLHRLLHQTVTNGESNSCLMIGNRGTGKSALVRRILLDLKKNNNTFCVVRLNGLTETNDRLALSEMARQLVVEQSEQQQQERSFTSFAESFSYILSLLKSGDRTTLPIIFVLDEFDLFAQHPKQALLYNLLDAAQSAQNPMAVVGLTCRLDTLDLLEKRVKSRFSHRQIYLFPQSTLTDFIEVARDSLRLPKRADHSPSFVVYAKKFNKSIETLFQDAVVNGILQRIFHMTRDLRLFYKICFEPASRLSLSQPFLEASHFHDASVVQCLDAKTEILKGVSLLELILIVSMKNLVEKDITVFNFQMLYDEYKDFMSTTQVQGMGFGMKLYKHAVALKVMTVLIERASKTHLKAFENLQTLELVRPVAQVAKCPKEYRMAKLLIERAQVIEAVLKYKDCPVVVRNWATSSID